MVTYGIDWTKIALEVNDERRKAISSGTKSAGAFNVAYRAVTHQHPEITGDAWKEGRKIVGTILAAWKKEKDLAAKAKKSLPVKVAEKTPSPKKSSRGKSGKRQGELDL